KKFVYYYSLTRSSNRVTIPRRRHTARISVKPPVMFRFSLLSKRGKCEDPEEEVESEESVPSAKRSCDMHPQPSYLLYLAGLPHPVYSSTSSFSTKVSPQVNLSSGYTTSSRILQSGDLCGVWPSSFAS
ncbi:hypothetical protein PIB30_099473, partial [Stylosanthes scabra]|nr:hypothetical protein [Stylosanthes scabra]